MAENGEDEPSDKLRMLRWAWKHFVFFIAINIVPWTCYRGIIITAPSQSKTVIVNIVLVCVSIWRKKTHGWRCPSKSRWDSSAHTKMMWESQSLLAEERRCVLLHLKRKKIYIYITWGKDYLEAKEASVCLTPWHFGPISDSRCLQEENKALNLLTDVGSAVKKLAEWPGIP